MAKGNPILAVWNAEEVIRVYELTEGGFVQIDSLGSVPHFAGEYGLPAIYFPQDGEYLLLRGNSSVDDLNQLGTYLPTSPSSGRLNNVLRPNGTDAGLGIGVFSPLNNVYAFISTSETDSARLNNFTQITETGGFQALDSITRNDTRIYSSVSAVSFSPDEKFFVVAQPYPENCGVFLKVGTSFAYGVSGTNFNRNPNYNLDTDEDIDFIVWSLDSNYMITAAKNGPIQSYIRDGDNLLFSNKFTDTLGNPIAMAASPDGKTIAIGFNNSDVIKTGLYKRIGPYLIKQQTLSGIGELLDFTADGAHLIDAASRKTFKRGGDGQFAELTGAMDSLPTAVEVQGVSPHVNNPTGMGKLYTISIEDLISGGVDLGNLKMTLLTSDVVFSSSHTTLDEVTSSGANEVSDGGWPAGGKDLTVVRTTLTGGRVGLVADPVTHVSITGGMSTRYAVIYDKSDMRPLVFIDFLAEQTVPVGTELKFDFGTSGIIVYSS